MRTHALVLLAKAGAVIVTARPDAVVRAAPAKLAFAAASTSNEIPAYPW